MNSTTVVAIAGILGTLLAPVVAGRVQRRLMKADRIMDRRIDTYAELMEIAGKMYEDAQTWSSIPLANLDEIPSARIRSVDGRIRVVGSDRVREATDRVARLATRFQADLFRARIRHQRDENTEQGDSPEAMAMRMNLGGIVDEMTRAIKELEARIQAEMKA